MLSVDVAAALGNTEIRAQFATGSGVTALFGQSGSGKSTIVNMVAGLVRPRAGRIEIDGTVLFDSSARIDIPARKRHVGYVFQESRLFPHMSVARNLTYGQWAGRRKGSRDFDEVVRLLGLEDLLNRPPETLSGGERQRVAIGRALLASPKVLLMDEPLASLDGARKAEILPYLERLRAEAGVPILYVSHALDEITRFADDLVVVSDGSVLAYGPIADVLGRIDLGPATGRHEAGAILEGVVRERDRSFDLTGVTVESERFFLPGLDAPLGTPVRLRVRARDVSLALEKPTAISIQNVIRAEVFEIGKPQGPYVELVLAVGAQRLRARVTTKSAAVLDLHRGKPVFALIKSVAIDRRSIGPVRSADEV
ncbi:MAG: molybdenum ABC transporter ATP-binding protein [Pseudomonadota bacterium]